MSEDKSLTFLSTSHLGSDEMFEMYCETCYRDGKHAIASVFCTSCISYFCPTCSDYHGKFLHDHICLFGDNMPHDVCTEKCAIHPKEVLKFDCVTCKAFACSTCKRVDHKTTCDLKYLPDVVKDLEQGNEFKQLNVVWGQITRKITDAKRKANEQQENVHHISSKAKLYIKEVKDSLFEEFDNEADEIERAAFSMIKVNIEHIDNMSEKIASINPEIGCLLNGITHASVSQSKEKYKLFIKMKEMIPKLLQLEKNVDELSERGFSHGAPLQNELGKRGSNLTEKVNQFSKTTRQLKTNMKATKEEQKRKVARFVGDINVSSPFDSGYCYIGDCCLMSEQCLIACDKTNSSVKLIDTKDKTVIYVRRIKTIPEAVTKMSHTTFALVHPYDNDKKRSIIQFLIVINNKFLEFEKGFILTQMYCTNIAYLHDDTFIISMWADHRGKVQVIDMSGCILANFENNAKGENIFRCPNFITLNNKGTVVYASDWYRDSITAINIETRAVQEFPRRFWHPEGVTTDEQGFVYVCESGTNRIHVFCPDGDNTSADLLIDEKSTNWQPLAICYSFSDRKLYVSQYDLNFMKVYEISDG